MKRKESIKLYISLLTCAALMFMSVSFGVFGANKWYMLNRGADFELEEIEKPLDIGLVNVLLLGKDDNMLTDTIMLVSINGVERKVNVLSIPRDTRTAFGGYFGKINEAHYFGTQEVQRGRIKEPEDYVIGKIKALTGLPIHYFATINTSGFRNIIDILDGVEIDVPDVEGGGRGMNYYDPTPGHEFRVAIKPGLQTLNGVQSEGFMRYRSGYPEGDVGRIRAQQQFIKALTEQKLRPEYLLKINELFNAVFKNIKTNFVAADMARYAVLINSISSDNVQTFQVPGAGEYINELSYFIPNLRELEKLMDEHFRFKANAEISSETAIELD